MRFYRCLLTALMELIVNPIFCHEIVGVIETEFLPPCWCTEVVH